VARLKKEIASAVARKLGVPEGKLIVSPLPGDASLRSYFRLFMPSGRSFILTLYPEPFSLKGSDFYRVYQLFRKARIPVPEVIAADGEKGFFLLEDGGDLLLQNFVEENGMNKALPLYKRVLDILISIETDCFKLLSRDHPAIEKSFTGEKFLSELEFFWRYYVEGMLKVVLSSDDEKKIKGFFHHISGKLAGKPKTLCHRDYHSRNILVNGDKLFIVDFQDARLGPFTYDLASLLRDSYIEIPRDVREELLSYYFSHHPSLPFSDIDELKAEFDLTSLQRNLKAVGTFAYQHLARDNDFYLKFIPGTLSYVRENLANFPCFKPVFSIFYRLFSWED
jgi:aminoglycoside/choline kinase family phosphotransferase